MPSPPAASVDGQTPKRRGPGRPRLVEPSPGYRARQEEIIAAAAVFHDKGYDAGTLDDVAVALGLRRASLYHYVRSKANLLHLIFERALDRALAELDEALKIEEPASRLEALIRHQARTITRDPSLFTVFLDHRPRLQAEYEQAIQKRERRYLGAYRAAVSAAVHRRGDRGRRPALRHPGDLRDDHVVLQVVPCRPGQPRGLRRCVRAPHPWSAGDPVAVTPPVGGRRRSPWRWPG